MRQLPPPPPRPSLTVPLAPPEFYEEPPVQVAVPEKRDPDVDFDVDFKV